MLYIGHEQCYAFLDRLLRAYEAGGYTRLVRTELAESVLMDSRPAPGYVPGAPGKRETGVDYVPAGDGTMLDAYYLAAETPTAKQIAEADRAIRSGFKAPNLLGAIVSIKRAKNGNIVLQMIAGNREHIENDMPTNKLALRALSVAPTPEAGGVLVALAADQTLGIPFHQLQQMAEGVAHMPHPERARTISRRIRRATERPDPPQGATGPGQGVEA